MRAGEPRSPVELGFGLSLQQVIKVISVPSAACKPPAAHMDRTCSEPLPPHTWAHLPEGSGAAIGSATMQRHRRIPSVRYSPGIQMMRQQPGVDSLISIRQGCRADVVRPFIQVNTLAWCSRRGEGLQLESLDEAPPPEPSHLSDRNPGGPLGVPGWHPSWIHGPKSCPEVSLRQGEVEHAITPKAES